MTSTHTPMTITRANVPMPKLNRVAPPGRPSQYREPLAALKVGDGSCILDETGTDPEKAAQRFSSAVAQYKKTTGDKSKFTVRSYKEEVDGVETGKVIVGVWKLADAPAAAAPVADAGTAATDGAQEVVATEATNV